MDLPSLAYWIMSVFKFDRTTTTVAQLHDLAALTVKYLFKKYN